MKKDKQKSILFLDCNFLNIKYLSSFTEIC